MVAGDLTAEAVNLEAAAVAEWTQRIVSVTDDEHRTGESLDLATATLAVSYPRWIGAMDLREQGLGRAGGPGDGRRLGRRADRLAGAGAVPGARAWR